MVDIDTMPAGREMDVLIAEKVFGAEVYNTARNPKESFLPRSRQMLGGPSCGSCEQNGLGGDAYEIPDYSTDIEAAWYVVQMMIERLAYFDVGKHSFQWYASFNAVSSRAETAPLAICRAALKAC